MRECINCNHRNRKNDKYCRNCGYKLHNNGYYIMIDIMLTIVIISLLLLVGLFVISYLKF